MTSVTAFKEAAPSLPTGEVDHRIANSLALVSSLVRSKARLANIDDVRQLLFDVAGRIETVARLHRLLASADTTGIPLKRFLSDVCAAMSSIATEDDRIKLTIECSSERTLPSDKALRVGLLTTELFSNSIKYAHPTGVPTIITLRCREEPEGVLEFSFEDDGIGFPEGFDPAGHDSLGMKILNSLSAQLHGRSEWEDLGIGLRFVCRFPLDRRRDGPPERAGGEPTP